MRDYFVVWIAKMDSINVRDAELAALLEIFVWCGNKCSSHST